MKKEIRECFSDSFCHVELGDILLGENKQDFSTPLSFRSKGQKPRTIYFGGGTPSVLSLEEVRGILECFPLSDSPPFRGSQRGYSDNTPPSLPYKGSNTKLENVEITFECNPEDITTEYIVGLLDLGINRISLGVQSLNNETLSAIHRSDESTIFDALNSIHCAIVQTGKIGVSVNVDFILGLPHVQKGETLENIKILHKNYSFITHTSVYILEKGLYPKSWKSHTLDDLLIQDEFMNILDYFDSVGWNHYELSNWARPGYESGHNQSYWDHSNYRGFGPSAASYIDGKRWSNSDSFSGYYRGDVLGEEILTPEQISIEQLMFGLRTSGGFDMGDTDIELNQVKIQEFISNGLIVQENTTIQLTKTGIFLIDYIMGELIS